MDGDNKPVAMFGAAPYAEMGTPPGTCVLWMLSTERLVDIKRAFLDQVPGWLDYLQRFHPIGFNLISADNHVALKWAERVGFGLHETSPRGKNGELFTLILRKV